MSKLRFLPSPRRVPPDRGRRRRMMGMLGRDPVMGILSTPGWGGLVVIGVPGRRDSRWLRGGGSTGERPSALRPSLCENPVRTGLRHQTPQVGGQGGRGRVGTNFTRGQRGRGCNNPGSSGFTRRRKSLQLRPSGSSAPSGETSETRGGRLTGVTGMSPLSPLGDHREEREDRVKTCPTG